ncbi:MAG: prepilin peptidase [Pseudomonadota bacterium]
MLDDTYLWILRIAFGGYILLLTVAALFDVWKFIIPNTICVAVLVLFIPTALLLPFDVNWWSHIGAAVAVLAVGAGAYAMGWFGAGDVKLLTAVSFWMGFAAMPQFLLYVALAGGGFALGLLFFRYVLMSLRTTKLFPETMTFPRIFLVGEAVPYGVAIALGSILAGNNLPYLGKFL